jgi:hypothetical protein
VKIIHYQSKIKLETEKEALYIVSPDCSGLTKKATSILRIPIEEKLTYKNNNTE